MTLYLTDNTAPEEIARARAQRLRCTAASSIRPAPPPIPTAGVTDIARIDACWRRMSGRGHAAAGARRSDRPGRSMSSIAKRASSTRCCRRCCERLPGLRIVFEHVTTREAVEFVRGAGADVAATVTPQHLLLNRNALFAGGIRPHHYCLPVLKRETRPRGAAGCRRQRRSALLPRHRQRAARAPRQGERLRLRRHLQRARRASNCTPRSSTAGAGCARLAGFAAISAPTSTACRAITDFITLVEEPWTCPHSYRLWRRHAGAAARRRDGRLALLRAWPRERDREVTRTAAAALMSRRFRGFLPVVIDVETGGFNRRTDALLEIAAVFIDIDASGTLCARRHPQLSRAALRGRATRPGVAGVNRHRSLSSAASRARRSARPCSASSAKCATAKRSRLPARHPGGPQRGLRSGLPQRGAGTHRHQAQSLPPLLLLRHRDAGRARRWARPCWPRQSPSPASSWDHARRTRPPTTPSARRSVLLCLQSHAPTLCGGRRARAAWDGSKRQPCGESPAPPADREDSGGDRDAAGLAAAVFSSPLCTSPGRCRSRPPVRPSRTAAGRSASSSSASVPRAAPAPRIC